MDHKAHIFSSRFLLVGACLLAAAALVIFYFARSTAGPAPAPAVKGPDAPPALPAIAVIPITIACPGMASSLVDETVLLPLSQAIKSVPGFQSVHSIAEEGQGRLDVAVLKDDAFQARQDLSEVMARLQPTLPDGVQPPTILRRSPDALPDFWLVVRSDGRQDVAFLSRVVDIDILPAMERLPGVSSSIVVGAARRVVSIEPDLMKMKAAGMVLIDLANALNSKDVKATRADQFAEIVVAHVGGKPLNLLDVAVVREMAVPSGFAHFAGGPAVAVGVYLRKDADRDAVEAAVDKLVNEWATSLAEGISVVRTPAEPEVLLLEAVAGNTSADDGIDSAVRKFERDLQAMLPQLPPTLIVRGPQQAAPTFLLTSFKDAIQRRDAVNAVYEINRRTNEIDVRISDLGESRLPWPVRIAVLGSDHKRKGEELLNSIQSSDSEVIDAGLQTERSLPRDSIHLDRDKARVAGIALADIQRTLSIALGTGLGDKSYRIFLGDKPDLDKVMLAAGKWVPLSSLISIGKELEPVRIDRVNGNRCTIITAGLQPGGTMAAARPKIESLAAKTKAEIVFVP